MPFPPARERFERLEEAIQLMRAMWSGGPVRYDGRYYRVDGVDLQPKPATRMPLVIGGSGEQRTLRVVARYAGEWNSVGLSAKDLARKNEVLARHCEAERRDPNAIRRSMMNFAMVGPDERFRLMVAERLSKMPRRGEALSAEQTVLRGPELGMIGGTTQQVVDQLGELSRLGLEEVMFQHLFYERDEVPEYLAREIIPKVRDL
ncbi:MAG: LLM class flavin-dependent oxidoreductase [SAR202 cluster bacterium]|nr:LLM class flavin-dependent oxidoreductase [SAR202 cluster bacterium]